MPENTAGNALGSLEYFLAKLKPEIHPILDSGSLSIRGGIRKWVDEVDTTTQHFSSQASTMKEALFRAWRRAASTLTKESGDISSVFPSLSGKPPEPLPARFADLKKTLIRGNEDAVKASWQRLLTSLKSEVDEIKTHNSAVCFQRYSPRLNADFQR